MTKRNRRPHRKPAAQQARAEKPTFWYAVMNERYIAGEVVDSREDIAAVCALNGVRRIRHPYSRIDIARNRVSKKFTEITQHPDSGLVLLDTDHLHDPRIVLELLKYGPPEQFPIIAGLNFRRSEPYDPQVYLKDGDGNLQQPVEWKPGLLKADIVGSAAILIRRRVFDQLKAAGEHYPWWRMMYTDSSDTLLGEDWYFMEACGRAGVDVYCDMTLISPHMDALWIDEKPWLLRQGHIVPDQRAAQGPEPWLHDAQSMSSNQKWADLRDRHKGETAIIIGNGPSLRETPMDFLKQFPTFGTNRIYTIDHLKGWAPTYYACVNPLVLDQFGREAIQAYRGKAHRFFLAVNYLRNNPIGQQPSVIPLVSLADRRFFTDPSLGLYEGHTVTFVALQLAYWMGFSKVGLVGVDHRYEFEGQPNQELVAEGPDPNHASESYFTDGVRWHAPDLERSEEAYRLAREAFEADGREIVNLTPGTALDVFEKGDWEEWQKPRPT